MLCVLTATRSNKSEVTLQMQCSSDGFYAARQARSVLRELPSSHWKTKKRLVLTCSRAGHGKWL